MDTLYLVIKKNQVLACRNSYAEAFEVAANIAESNIQKLELAKKGSGKKEMAQA
ncbi:MAG: hypothetical protein WD077_02290 [Bacteroidia bacterium]